jgi:sugar phosphate isomerase/epimerase
MKASRRRAVGAAAAAVATVVLATTATAFAQKPEKVGDGVRTGQLGVQITNYGAYIDTGEQIVPNARFGPVDPLGPNPPAMGVSQACRTATTSECRWERLERLFAFLASKGVTNIELIGHAGFPANDDIAGLLRYRALLDKYGLHAGGWHGDATEATWDARLNAARILGMDYIGAVSGAGLSMDSYGDALAMAQLLNRLGKRSVEAGVGPVYFHNHQADFVWKYLDEGVLKTAWEVVMDHTDPRYVVAEIDVKWSSDGMEDPSGTLTAAFINQYGARVALLHVKDGNGIDEVPFPDIGPFAAVGQGEIDFRPIFAAATNRVRYFFQEHDLGSLTDANVSLTNLHGQGPAVTGSVLGSTTTFPSVAAGTRAADNVVPVVLSNTGEAPLTFSNATNALQIQVNPLDAPPTKLADLNRVVSAPPEFQIISDTCRGQTLTPTHAPTASAPLQRSSCVVNIGFGPARTNSTSVARLVIDSSSDAATEQVLLIGKSTNQAIANLSGDVSSSLQLSVTNSGGSFGSFLPGVARDYVTQLAADVTTTTGDAALTVSDPSTNNPGRLVNGSTALASPVAIRAVGLGDTPLPAYTSLPTTNTPLVLRSWSAPATAALTLDLRQSIGAADTLRAGTYRKTLTFTLSTTTP